MAMDAEDDLRCQPDWTFWKEAMDHEMSTLQCCFLVMWNAGPVLTNRGGTTS